MRGLDTTENVGTCKNMERSEHRIKQVIWSYCQKFLK